MSTVEDIRKVLQDFIAPELRTLSARFDVVDAKIESLAREMSTRFESVDVKFDFLAKEIQGISDKLDLDRRLTKLESQQVSIAAKTA